MLVNYSRDEIRKHLEEVGHFNGFPIEKRPIGEEQKGADYRYDAQRTALNQKILASENWGVIARKGFRNCILDFDNKERYRQFVELLIKEGYFVVESPQGWHVYVTNVEGDIKKTELFDYDYQDKKIIEIQGFDHYVVGANSEIFDEETGNKVRYELRGGLKFWDFKGKTFDELISFICQKCNVEKKKPKLGSSSIQKLREKFKKRQIPSKGTSNDYFHQASRVCLTEGLTKDEAYDEIKSVFDEWTKHPDYSNRPWSNVSYKIDEVYNDPDKFKIKQGRPMGNSSGIDRTAIAENILQSRDIYSDRETDQVYENQKGFLKPINNILKAELYQLDKSVERADYESIKFKLVSAGKDIPKTNHDLVVFKNGVFSRRAGTLIETDDLASMGFENYDYIENAEPTEFIKIMFDGIPEAEKPRVRAGLKSALTPLLDEKISVLQGLSRIGKTARLMILAKCLGQYALVVELGTLLNDSFIQAKLKGKTLLVLDDLPEKWGDLNKIKNITGTNTLTQRGFQQDSSTFDNMIKIWASTNNVTKIPSQHKEAIYPRLSLIQTTRKEKFKQDSTLIDRIVEEEGEQIISWILNLKDSECVYEDTESLKKKWESIADPEINYIKTNYELELGGNEYIPLLKIKQDYENSTGNEIDLDILEDSIKKIGFPLKSKMVFNIKKTGESS